MLKKDSVFVRQHAPKFFSRFGSAIYKDANNTRRLGFR